MAKACLFVRACFQEERCGEYRPWTFRYVLWVAQAIAVHDRDGSMSQSPALLGSMLVPSGGCILTGPARPENDCPGMTLLTREYLGSHARTRLEERTSHGPCEKDVTWRQELSRWTPVVSERPKGEAEGWNGWNMRRQAAENPVDLAPLSKIGLLPCWVIPRDLHWKCMR